jgi:hypothetical protein
MSYQVQLKPRLENIKAPSVPKQCSSCSGKPAPRHRSLTSLQRMEKRAKVQWTIQLPLCEPCYQMYQVLYHYLPSQHGTPEQRRSNRRTSLVQLGLFLVTVVSIALPESLVPWLTALNKFGILLVMGALIIGITYWNSRASQNARSALYKDLVQKAGHEFGDVEIRSAELPRSTFSFGRQKGDVQGPTLLFDNEAFGRAFEKANRDLLASNKTDT